MVLAGDEPRPGPVLVRLKLALPRLRELPPKVVDIDWCWSVQKAIESRRL